jgi:diguanylate cyclase (GGDEF)-like protein
MRAVSEIAPSRPGRLAVRRFVLLGTTTAVPPALLVAQGLGLGAPIDWPGIAAGSLLLFALVLARVWTLVGQVQDQATQLEALAHSDALTGTANRRTWDLALPRELAAAGRAGRSVAVAVVDLDHFKRFNDTHGHQRGDELLREAAAAWQALLRDGDLLARYGGEEFGVLLPDADGAAAVDVLQRLLASTPGDQTFSAGVAVWDGVESPERLVGRADEALYAAKHAGRNRVVLAAAPREARQEARTSP